MAKQVSFNEDANISVYRVVQDKTGGAWNRYGVNADMKDMAKGNGATGFQTNGSVYVAKTEDIASEDTLFVILSTEPPKGWVDPTVKKSRKKNNNS